MTTRRRKSVDKLAELKVEVYAALGETSLKAECALSVAAEVAARLHAELERLGQLKPSVLPRVEAVPGDSLYVPDEDEGAKRKRRGVGFAIGQAD